MYTRTQQVFVKMLVLSGLFHGCSSPQMGIAPAMALETTPSADAAHSSCSSELSHRAILPTLPTPCSTFPLEQASTPYTVTDKEDHQIHFKYEQGQWQASVREQIGAFSRQEVLSVACEEHGEVGAFLEKLQHQPSQYAQHQVHVVHTKRTTSPGKFVYLGRQGLQGGGYGMHKLVL